MSDTLLVRPSSTSTNTKLPDYEPDELIYTKQPIMKYMLQFKIKYVFRTFILLQIQFCRKRYVEENYSLGRIDSALLSEQGLFTDYTSDIQLPLFLIFFVGYFSCQSKFCSLITLLISNFPFYSIFSVVDTLMFAHFGIVSWSNIPSV